MDFTVTRCDVCKAEKEDGYYPPEHWFSFMIERAGWPHEPFDNVLVHGKNYTFVLCPDCGTKLSGLFQSFFPPEKLR